MVVRRGNTQQAKRGTPLKANGSKKVSSYTSLKSERHKWKRVKIEDLYENDQVKTDVIVRAKEIQANLAPEFPSIIKCMLPSNVTRVFWLHLPARFCAAHLPEEETMIVLEDEMGKCCETKYLPHKNGLSAGWRGFSIDHHLMEGDVLIFHLVEPTKFKVYIVRVNNSEVVDGAISLLKLEAGIKQMSPVNEAVRLENPSKVSKDMEDLDFENRANLGPLSTLSENEREDYGSDITDGIRLSESIVDFKEVKNFEDFDIIVNGLAINSELPKHLQAKYYELCCSQKSFLHGHILEGLNCKLVAGVLSETINIADAIRASKLITALDNFAIWEKTLIAFEGLGMKVGFLLARLGQLTNLSAKLQRYKEVRFDGVYAKEEAENLDAELFDVKETIKRLDAKIEALELNVENMEIMFQQVAKAPW